MSGQVVDLLAARRARQRPALTFDTDLEALEFAAAHLDRLHEQVRDSLFIDCEAVRLPIGQAAAIVRACMCVHSDRHEEDV